MVAIAVNDLLRVAPHVLTAGKAAKGQQGSPTSMLLLMFVLIAVSFYFIILRPQKKEQAQRKQLLQNMKKGDKVISIGGIHGTLVDIDEKSDTVTLEVAKNTRITFLRSAISTVKEK